jgi:hypothetical protein
VSDSKDVLLLELQQLSERSLKVFSNVDRKGGIIDFSRPSDSFERFGEIPVRCTDLRVSISAKGILLHLLIQAIFQTLPCLSAHFLGHLEQIHRWWKRPLHLRNESI